MLNLRCQQCWLHHKTICFGFFQSWFTDFWMKGHQLFTSCLTRKHHSYPTIHHLQPSSSLSANIIHTYTTNWWEEAYHRNLTANTSSLTHPSSLCNPFFFFSITSTKTHSQFHQRKKREQFPSSGIQDAKMIFHPNLTTTSWQTRNHPHAQFLTSLTDSSATNPSLCNPTSRTHLSSLCNHLP